MWNASPNITLHIGSFILRNYYSIIVIVAALGIVITAAYVLRVVGTVFFGEFDAKRYADVGDITITDRIILFVLGTPLIVLGIYPAIMAPMIQSGVGPILALLGGGA
jgi:NADH-quinone oxidoreductase subunit M